MVLPLLLMPLPGWRRFSDLWAIIPCVAQDEGAKHSGIIVNLNGTASKAIADFVQESFES